MKTKQEWLFQFRKSTSRDTLEKVIEINRYKLPLSES
ncbi:hemolysin activation protein, partial [Escherichia coli]|nr:hemolysin activation protein [Escherichia coli]